MCARPVVDVFWTGGWDSSFRVLELALVHGIEVQPHYIVDVDRISSLHELRAMRTMREMVAARDAEAAARIRPLRVVAVNDIAPDAGISAQYAALRRKSRLGGQYEFLRRYAAQQSLEEVEVGWVRPPTRSSYATQEFFQRHLKRRERPGGVVTWKIDGVDSDVPLGLLNGFSFPLVKLTKQDISEVAREHGFVDILAKSWFCHLPILGRPCGYCAPCVQTIQDGMADRVGVGGRLRYPLRSFLFPLRTLREQPTLVRRRWRTWVRARLPLIGG